MLAAFSHLTPPHPTIPTIPQFSLVDIATMFGILCGYVSTFLAWSYTRAGVKLGRLQVGSVAACVPAWDGNAVPGCSGLAGPSV